MAKGKGDKQRRTRDVEEVLDDYASKHHAWGELKEKIAISSAKVEVRRQELARQYSQDDELNNLEANEGYIHEKLDEVINAAYQHLTPTDFGFGGSDDALYSRNELEREVITPCKKIGEHFQRYIDETDKNIAHLQEISEDYQEAWIYFISNLKSLVTPIAEEVGSERLREDHQRLRELEERKQRFARGK